MTVPIPAPVPLPMRPKISFSELLSSFRLIDEDDIAPEELERRAEAEAEIHMRVFQLRLEGAFIGRPLMRKAEPSVKKAHWDYLLQEMTMVSEEMSKDRRLKSFLGKKYARAVARHFEIQQEKESRQEREEEKRLKKIASGLARDVLRFWKKIEKVVNLKKESKLKEIQNAAMDKHLDFIVGETEKYSVLLAEKLVGMEPASDLSTPKSDKETPAAGRMSTEVSRSATPQVQPAAGREPSEALQESAAPGISDIMKGDLEGGPSSASGEHSAAGDENDGEFVPPAEAEEDDEQTLDQDEKEEEENKDELNDLAADADLPIEELMARYGYGQPPTSTSDKGAEKDVGVVSAAPTTGDQSPRDIASEEEGDEEEEEEEDDQGEERPPGGESVASSSAQVTSDAKPQENDGLLLFPPLLALAVFSFRRLVFTFCCRRGLQDGRGGG